MIRLATAHSKLRMSRSVTNSDIDIAVDLINISLFGKSINEEEDNDEEEVREE